MFYAIWIEDRLLTGEQLLYTDMNVHVFKPHFVHFIQVFRVPKKFFLERISNVCVCVYMCVWERERTCAMHGHMHICTLTQLWTSVLQILMDWFLWNLVSVDVHCITSHLGTSAVPTCYHFYMKNLYLRKLVSGKRLFNATFRILATR
jgi:hypothetical protein